MAKGKQPGAVKGVFLSLLLFLFTFCQAYSFPIYQSRGALGPEVDMQGYLGYWVNLTTLDFGQGLTLPLSCDYSSRMRGPSPYLGTGWRLSLLESVAYEVSETSYAVTMLGGKTLYFIKDTENPTLYKHRGEGWSGLKRGTDFIITAKNGISMEFLQGRISSITNADGRVIEWRRQNGLVYELGERGQKPTLLIESDSMDGVKALLVNGKRFQVQRDLVSGGLSKLVWPDGRESVFKRDQDEKGSPRFQAQHPGGSLKTMAWSLADGRVTSVDDWKYTILPALKTVDKKKVEDTKRWPELQRINLKTGVKESYNYDTFKGICTMLKADGSIIKEYEFLNPGPLFRKISRVERTYKGKTEITQQWRYDENGKVLQHMMKDLITDVAIAETFDSAGRLVSKAIAGQPYATYAYDDKGKLISEAPKAVQVVAASLPSTPLPNKSNEKK